ncbi:MAG TPA: ABC transporter permease subunit [Pseudonocardiaceae bacterium]
MMLMLRAEWTKFRSVRGWVIGMLVAVGVTVLIGLLGPLGTNIGCGDSGGSCAGNTPPTGPDGEFVADSFYFVHQSLTGDGSITARVTSLTGQYSPNGTAAVGQGGADLVSGVQPWSKAGIIIKQNLNAGSAYAAVMLTGSNGVRMQDNYTHDTAGSAAARWLRLTRAGDTITGYDSTDGTNWTAIGTTKLSGTAQIGLFTTSPGHEVITQSFGGSSGRGGPTRATAVFDNVDRTGPWTGTAVGGSTRNTGFQQTPNGFTVTGSGDIAPIVATGGSLTTRIESALVGVFAGLIAVIVVAALFITAEYRRGLIRTTLAASPWRGRVLAAKALVVGGVSFVVGLVAAVIVIPVVLKLDVGKGLSVFPVSTWTEVRVVGGTALVLAVTAVLALAVGTIMRRSAGAVTAVIVAVVLPYILAVASVLPAGAAEWLMRITPAAAFAIQQSEPAYAQVTASYTPNSGYFPLPPWGGFAVLCGYTALALGVAALLLRRRDA